MSKRLWIFLTCLIASASMAFAQKTVTGVVTDIGTGEPLVGVHVKVNGQALGITDINGKFTINNVPADAKTVDFSYMGYEDAMSAVRDIIRIGMAPTVANIDEVVVVAYGSQKRSSFTGAATTIKGEELEKLQVSNLSKALEGAVAGVQTFSSSGTPGSGATILVRGIGSISGSKTPLIVLDGVPYEGSLNSISTHDIESMTILKDAAANSMYGARGANGVIMITTKSAKTNGAKVDFDARWGFNARGVQPYDIVSDAGEYYEMFWEAVRNSKIDELGMVGANQYASDNLIEMLKYNKFKGIADTEIIDPATGKLNPKARQYKWDDDWQTDPFENGFRQEYNATITSGTENSKIFASLGYLGDEGYMVGSDFQRYSARLKFDQNMGENIRIGGNISYANTNQKFFNSSVGSNFSNIFMFTQNIAPIYPIYLYDNDGNYILNDNDEVQYDFGTYRPYGKDANPLAVAKKNDFSTVRDNINTRGYFEWTFLNDFKFTANIAYDIFNTQSNSYATPIGGDALNVGGRGTKGYSRYYALNLNQLLDWNHKFGDHSAHILLGHETKNDKSKSMSGEMTNFADPNNSDFSNAAQYQDLGSSTSEYALEGYFAKGEYNFADKYYFTASIRRDGSSRFHKDNRWGTFWAVGGAWRLNEESWMKDVKFVNNLKLKASYGTQGNDNIGYAHNYTDLYSVDRVDGAPAFTKVNRGNKDLTWEKSRNFNIGFEAGLWRRLNINFDFFIKETKDLLYASPLAPSQGSPSYIYRNEMDMKNTGFEIEVNGDIIRNRNMRWNAAINLTHYKNELTRLPNSKPADIYPNGYQAGDYWRQIGGSLYDYFMYEYVGVDPTNGKPQYMRYNYKTDPATGKTLHEGYTYGNMLDADGNIVYQTDKDGNYILNENGEKIPEQILTSIGTGDEIIESTEIVNEISNATERRLGKSSIPDLTGGFSTTFEAYGFDLSISTAFQLGGYVFDTQYNSLMTAGSEGHNFHKDMFNRWTPAHTDTNIPALGYNVQDAGISGNSDYYLTSASYFSLRNITLGYTFPTKAISRLGINKLRVYLSGDNIWLLSKRKGLDPRQSYDGDTGYVYSALSSYSIGLSLSF